MSPPSPIFNTAESVDVFSFKIGITSSLDFEMSMLAWLTLQLILTLVYTFIKLVVHD